MNNDSSVSVSYDDTNNKSMDIEELKENLSGTPVKSIKTASKLSKEIQREYLLKSEEFVISFGNVLKFGVTDKGESGRKKAFKLLQRLESENEGKLLEDLMTNKWDAIIAKKFANCKKLE